MRKIETQMNTAIKRGKDFRSGNTEVNAFTCGAPCLFVSLIIKDYGTESNEQLCQYFNWFNPDRYKRLQQPQCR